MSALQRSVVGVNPDTPEANELREWWDSEGITAPTQHAGEGLASARKRAPLTCLHAVHLEGQGVSELRLISMAECQNVGQEWPWAECRLHLADHAGSFKPASLPCHLWKGVSYWPTIRAGHI